MPAKKAAERVTVTAIENENLQWIHQGKTMKPGETAEVTKKQAAKLKKDKLIG